MLGKKSGLSSIKLKVEELGLDLPEDQFGAVLAQVKDKATGEERLISDDEFRQMVASVSAAA